MNVVPACTFLTCFTVTVLPLAPVTIKARTLESVKSHDTWGATTLMPVSPIVNEKLAAMLADA